MQDVGKENKYYFIMKKEEEEEERSGCWACQSQEADRRALDTDDASLTRVWGVEGRTRVSQLPTYLKGGGGTSLVINEKLVFTVTEAMA